MADATGESRKQKVCITEAGEISGTLRSRPRRSRSGCVTCRSLRIKCDEESPACGRCTRLQVPCSKPRPPVPLKQRRRGCGSWKSRESRKLPQILSIENRDKQSQDKTNPTLTTLDIVGDQSVPSSASSAFEPITRSSSDVNQPGLAESSPDPPEAWTSANRNDLGLEMRSEVAISAEQDHFPNVPLSMPWDDTLIEMGLLSAPHSMENFTHSGVDLNTQFHGTREDGDDWLHTDPYRYHPYSTNLLSETQQRIQTPATFVDTPQAFLQMNQQFESQTGWLQFLPSPGSTFSTSSSSLLCGIEPSNSSRADFTDLDHQAIQYYCTEYSKSRSIKEFEWSAYSIFLRKGSEQPIIMHFILAISLRGLLPFNRPAQVGCAAEAHLNKGLRMLHSLLVEKDRPDHLTVIISFWLLMLFALDPNTPMTGSQRRWLSSKIASYVKKHSIDKLWDNHYEVSELQENIYSQDATNALLARVLSYIVYTDVQLNFNQHGTELADIFIDPPRRIRTLRYSSQNFLELNHGSDYPSTELVHDIESIECYSVYLEQHRIYHKINKLFWRGIGEYTALGAEINALEHKYISFFKIANSICPSSSYSRLRFQIDAAVCEFYAIRLYHFRCKDQSPGAHVKNSVLSYLNIAHRVQTFNVRYSWFDRGLYIVGTETEDAIHRDWIRNRIERVDLKQSLERVWNTEANKLRRLEILEMRQILSGTAGCSSLESAPV